MLKIDVCAHQNAIFMAFSAGGLETHPTPLIIRYVLLLQEDYHAIASLRLVIIILCVVVGRNAHPISTCGADILFQNIYFYFINIF